MDGLPLQHERRPDARRPTPDEYVRIGICTKMEADAHTESEGRDLADRRAMEYGRGSIEWDIIRRPPISVIRSMIESDRARIERISDNISYLESLLTKR